MALLTRTGDQRWETHDGKYYLFGEYTGGSSLVRYSIGKRTAQGDEHIEDIKADFEQAFEKVSAKAIVA